jgi:hypothetical protein
LAEAADLAQARADAGPAQFQATPEHIRMASRTVTPS